LGANVTNFGAHANDGIDDTAAIIAAINSLPISDGAPLGDASAGGVVYFPAGTFDIRGPIMLRSGITLRGAGSGATVIRDFSTDRNGSAIILYSPYSHHFNIAAGVENLTLYTAWGKGISVDPNMADVVDFRIANVRISALGAAIDLRNQATQHSDFDNIEIYNPGSTAFFVGRADRTGFDTRIRNLRVTGTARHGFRAEQGLVMLLGDAIVQGISIRTTGANVVPLYMAGGTTGGFTFTDVDLQVPAINCPGGIAVLVEDTQHVEMESINNIGLARRIKLVNGNDVVITRLLTDGTSNSFASLFRIDSRSYARVGNNLNGTIVAVTSSAPPPAAHVRSPAPTTIIDVTSFGAIPNDGLDDTAAIQAAINSLPRGNGIPGGSQLVGGIVQFPVGQFNTSAPIKLPSGVWLRGLAAGTSIFNSCRDVASAAIEFTSPYTHHANYGAGVIELGISTYRARGIAADATVTGPLVDLTLSGVRLTSDHSTTTDSRMGPAIDLRNVTVSWAVLDRIRISNPASTALWLGKDDNSSSNNIIRGVRMAGSGRPNFQAEKALWVLYGSNTIEGGSIEDVAPDHQVTPMYASGSLKMSGLYMEFLASAIPNGVAFKFENMNSLWIDRLYHVNPTRRVSLVNVPNAWMSSLNIDGEVAFLRDCISVDSNSRFTIGAVNGHYDSGMLDHPRVLVQGFFNEAAGNFVETKIANSTPNLLTDPGMLSVGDDIWNVSDWQITWGNGYEGRLGSFVVESVGGVKRLRIDVPDTTNISLRIRLNVPASMTGRQGVARWRIDGPTQAFVYMHEWAVQLPARVMNSMTAAKTPFNLTTGDQIWISLPQAKGTYYFWKFGMAAA
jgi:hypothetical protein